MENFDDENLKNIVAKRISLFQKKPEAAVYKPQVSSRHVYGLYAETTLKWY